MKRNISILFGVLLLMYLSFRVGHHYGRTSVIWDFFNESVNSSAMEIGIKVKSLEMLKKGEIRKAEDLLERVVDSEISFLGVSADNKNLKDKKELLNAIKKVKDYREKHSEHAVTPSLKEGVIKAFMLVRQ